MGGGYLFPEIATVVSTQQISIMLEVLGEPKPGNVTGKKSFHDLAHEDFIRAAISIRDPLAAGYEEARQRSEASGKPALCIDFELKILAIDAQLRSNSSFPLIRVDYRLVSVPRMSPPDPARSWH